MKIISIEIQETKECHPYLEMIREVEPLPIKAVFEGADIKDLDVLPPSYKKDIYPSQTFAIDSHYERFYIRDEDKKAFEELVNAFVLRAEIRLLEEIIKYREETSKNAWKFIRELKKMKNTKTGSIEKIIGYDCVSWADGYCQALDDFSQRAREILT